MINTQKIKKLYPALLIALPLLTFAAFTNANGNYFASFASAGYGGQDTTYKHTFVAGDAIFDVTMTEREIDYRNAGGQLVCAPNNTPVVNLSTMGTLTEADLLASAAQCQPNITTLPQLVQAMREGKIIYNGTTLTLSGTTETPGQTGTPTPTTYSPTITPASTTLSPNGHVDFSGRNFAPEENVTITLDGTTVGSAHADGGGNFSTGSLTAPSTSGTYTYTFTGSTSNTPVSSTVTIQ